MPVHNIPLRPFSSTRSLSLCNSIYDIPLLAVIRLLPMASPSTSRWVRPEVYPLLAAVGVAVGICGMQLVRNITTNSEVRVTKQNRTAGVLDNFEEGEKYREHGFRKFIRTRTPEIMPSINKFFSDPN